MYEWVPGGEMNEWRSEGMSDLNNVCVSVYCTIHFCPLSLTIIFCFVLCFRPVCVITAWMKCQQSLSLSILWVCEYNANFFSFLPFFMIFFFILIVWYRYVSEILRKKVFLCIHYYFFITMKDTAQRTTTKSIEREK